MSQPVQGDVTPNDDLPTDRPGRRGRPRNRLATGAISAVGLSLAAFALLIPWVMSQAPRVRPDDPDVLRAAVTLLLMAAVILGAVTGHVLGLLAYSRQEVRDHVQSGRSLAMVSVVSGVVLLLGCMLFNVILGNDLVSLIANV